MTFDEWWRLAGACEVEAGQRPPYYQIARIAFAAGRATAAPVPPPQAEEVPPGEGREALCWDRYDHKPIPADGEWHDLPKICQRERGHAGPHGAASPVEPPQPNGGARVIVKKCWPDEWDAICEGRKDFEWRREDDVTYEVGDVLRLAKWDSVNRRLLGEEQDVRVTYVLRGAFGVPPGYAVLSIERCAPPASPRGEPPGGELLERAMSTLRELSEAFETDDDGRIAMHLEVADLVLADYRASRAARPGEGL